MMNWYERVQLAFDVFLQINKLKNVGDTQILMFGDFENDTNVELILTIDVKEKGAHLKSTDTAKKLTQEYYDKGGVYKPSPRLGYDENGVLITLDGKSIMREK